jgi:hypothetical protein
MGIEQVETIKKNIESEYSKINSILTNAGDVGHLTKEDMTNLNSHFDTLKDMVSTLDTPKFLAFLQDIDSFLQKVSKYDLEKSSTTLVDLFIDTAYSSKDIIELEVNGALEWEEYVEITNDVLKEFNRYLLDTLDNSDKFFENTI